MSWAVRSWVGIPVLVEADSNWFPPQASLVSSRHIFWLYFRDPHQFIYTYIIYIYIFVYNIQNCPCVVGMGQDIWNTKLESEIWDIFWETIPKSGNGWEQQALPMNRTEQDGFPEALATMATSFWVRLRCTCRCQSSVGSWEAFPKLDGLACCVWDTRSWRTGRGGARLLQQDRPWPKRFVWEQGWAWRRKESSVQFKWAWKTIDLAWIGHFWRT